MQVHPISQFVQQNYGNYIVNVLDSQVLIWKEESYTVICSLDGNLLKEVDPELRLMKSIESIAALFLLLH